MELQIVFKLVYPNHSPVFQWLVRQISIYFPSKSAEEMQEKKEEEEEENRTGDKT